MSVFSNPNTDPSLDLTFENVVEYFEEKKVKTECESCGCGQWTVNVSTLSNGISLTTSLPFGTSSGDYFLGTRGLEVVSVICMNCSLTRFYAKEPIERWLNLKNRNKENHVNVPTA